MKAWCSPGSGAMLRALAASMMARAMGCVDSLSSAAAAARRESSSDHPTAWICLTRGLPTVRVPVLSKQTAPRRERR